MSRIWFRKHLPVLMGLGRVLALVALLGVALGAADPVVSRKWTSYAYPSSFEHITVEQGLPQNIVRCLWQDRKGFLWIGTVMGLIRYDGFRFLSFHSDAGDPASLSGDEITCLLEDSRGYLWIGTNHGGLTILDLDTMRMLPIRASREVGGLPIDSVNALAEDRDGTVWVGTNGTGLCAVRREWRLPSVPRFITFAPSNEDPKGAPITVVNSLYVDPHGSLWIGSRVWGLGKLVSNRWDGKLIVDYHPLDHVDPDSAAHAVAYVIREDRFGDLWVGSDLGLLRFTPGDGRFQKASALAKESHGIDARRIMDIHESQDGSLWLASDGQGLFRSPPRQSPADPLRFQRFRHDPKDPGSLSGDGVQCLLEDRSGVLWISSYQAGLNKLILNPARVQDRERPDLRQFRFDPSDATSLSGNIVSAIGEDRFGNLWIGTDGFGLHRALASSKPMERIRFERYREDPERKPGALQSDVILTFHLDERKQLWMGTYDAGLVRVDQASPDARPTFTHYRMDPSNPTSLSSNFIRHILDDGHGGFWLATDGTALNHFDPRTGKARRYPWGGGANQLSNESIWCMAKDAYGTLWMATGNGLNRLNPETDEVRVYRPGGPGSISHPRIHTLHLDETEALWIGTGGGGLNKTVVPPWDGPQPVFTCYSLPEGLPSKVVQGILPDHKGNLWISTYDALCRFNIREGRAHPLTWQHELRRAEFTWNSCFRDSVGEMCFGSSDGLTLFHPEDIVYNPVVPAIAITEFQIMNRPVALGDRMLTGVTQGQEPVLTLYPSDKSISFDFSAMHYVAPERNRYFFLMEGLDRSWKEAGNVHSVSFTTLPAGDYVLRVRACNCDGIWGEDGIRLKIHVLPPWYKSWWFRGLALLILGGSIYSFIRIRLEVVHVRNRHLEEVVAVRTQELREANQALEEMSLTDPLTGLRNRRFLAFCMPDEVAQVVREQQDAARNKIERMKLNIDVLIVMVDIDHFKHVNDAHGHLAGDKVLRQLSTILKDSVRTSDTVTRWGGEEFLIVARHSARVDATVLPERIRAAVEVFPFDIGKGESISLTCSVGFSVFPLLPREMERFSWEQIVEIADTCLYAAKENGRNAWVGIVPDPESSLDASDERIPSAPEDIAKSGLFPVFTSLAKTIQW